MEYMGTKEASKRWGYSQNTISQWCRDGLIKAAEQDRKGSPWRIPVHTECPKTTKRSQNNKGVS